MASRDNVYINIIFLYISKETHLIGKEKILSTFCPDCAHDVFTQTYIKTQVDCVDSHS